MNIRNLFRVNKKEGSTMPRLWKTGFGLRAEFNEEGNEKQESRTELLKQVADALAKRKAEETEDVSGHGHSRHHRR